MIREAMELALQRLEIFTESHGAYPSDLEAIAALKVALEQQTQPVAWIQPDHLQKARISPFLCRVEPTKRCEDFLPLYTTPPVA